MSDDSSAIASFVAVLIWFAFLPLAALGIEICWNAVIPYLFHLPTLTYWKAFALGFLAFLLK